jgi:hypothetical protein
MIQQYHISVKYLAGNLFVNGHFQLPFQGTMLPEYPLILIGLESPTSNC